MNLNLSLHVLGTILLQIVFLTPTRSHQHPSQLQPNKKIIEMFIVFHKEMKVVNKEHQSILVLKIPFRNYDARIAFVYFEVPCCFEVHIPVQIISKYDYSSNWKTNSSRYTAL